MLCEGAGVYWVWKDLIDFARNHNLIIWGLGVMCEQATSILLSLFPSFQPVEILIIQVAVGSDLFSYFVR